jgi:hypothetical protein
MLRLVGALVLLGAAAQASALTPGPVQGKAIIGRPLELVVMAGGRARSGHCLRAEVSYGDSRLPDAMVTVAALPSGAAWRIRAKPAVNEPIVTLRLRVGCSAPRSWRYLLLADQDRRGSRAGQPVRAKPARLPAVRPVAAPVSAGAAGRRG